MKKTILKLLMGLGAVAMLTACGSSGSSSSTSTTSNEVASVTTCQVSSEYTKFEEAIFRLNCQNPDGISSTDARLYVNGEQKNFTFEDMTKSFEFEIIIYGEQLITLEVYVDDIYFEKDFDVSAVEMGPIASSDASFTGTTRAYDAVQKICYKKEQMAGEWTQYDRWRELHARGACITPITPEPDPDPVTNTPPTCEDFTIDLGFESTGTKDLTPLMHDDDPGDTLTASYDDSGVLAGDPVISADVVNDEAIITASSGGGNAYIDYTVFDGTDTSNPCRITFNELNGE